MAAATLLLVLTVVALGSGHVDAFDPNPLQDFCVADPTSKVHENGVACKDPAAVVAEDFLFGGLDKPGGKTSKRFGFTANQVQIPGLNTLGESHVRLDVVPGGVFPVHYHPRAAETALVLEGSVYFGFVSSYPDNKLYAKVLRKGDVFAVPQGLVHFLYNNGSAPATLYASLSSQNPGLVLLGNLLFTGALPDDLVAKTLLTDAHTVQTIKANFRQP
ncbi:germin-like protein 5-1 [Triticum aestivum]|uniref:germin-like protein 5-1 n=1 Tax=Triticum aestivum TaxID=4565 RepID=UPI001D019637|nr:germin-like protein 5-1 [Triticum aestivum]